MTRCGKMTAAVMAAGVLMFGGFAQAASLEFSLADSYGRQVTSQDYEGVPLFLEFGACW